MTKKKRARVDTDKGYEAPLLKYFDDSDKQRYLYLRGKASLTRAEQEEQRNLRAKANKWSNILSEWALHGVVDTLQGHRDAPEDPAEARNFLRKVVAPCYPLFNTVWVQQCVAGEHIPDAYAPARQGLESVLYAMDCTVMADTLADPERRLHFLASLDMMLAPFRTMKREPDPKLRMGEQSNLDKIFEFSLSGRGSRTRDQKDATSAQWGMPCFDVHLLLLVGIKITPAIQRVAAADSKRKMLPHTPVSQMV